METYNNLVFDVSKFIINPIQTHNPKRNQRQKKNRNYPLFLICLLLKEKKSKRFLKRKHIGIAKNKSLRIENICLLLAMKYRSKVCYSCLITRCATPCPLIGGFFR